MITKLSNPQPGHSILYYSIERGDRDTVDYLQTLKEDSCLSKHESIHLLIDLAAANGHDHIISRLVESQERSKTFLDEVGSKAVVNANIYNEVRSGKIQDVEVLLRNCSMYDQPDRFGCTLLMYAAYHGLDDLTKKLLKRGAVVDTIGIFFDAGYAQLCKAEDLAKLKGHSLVYKRIKDASKTIHLD